jgi:septal ring factor EnvC (AmiA/AmiB activator)
MFLKNHATKERDMKKWLAGLLTALIMAVFTPPVMASDGIEARLNQQQEHLNHLANSGEIAPKDRHRLERELNQIREKSRDPNLNREERHRLEGRMDRLDKDIDQARRPRKELIPGVPVPSIPTPR